MNFLSTNNIHPVFKLTLPEVKPMTLSIIIQDGIHVVPRTAHLVNITSAEETFPLPFALPPYRNPIRSELNKLVRFREIKKNFRASRECLNSLELCPLENSANSRNSAVIITLILAKFDPTEKYSQFSRIQKSQIQLLLASTLWPLAHCHGNPCTKHNSRWFHNYLFFLFVFRSSPVVRSRLSLFTARYPPSQCDSIQ